jgi:hypothetical protein
MLIVLTWTTAHPVRKKSVQEVFSETSYIEPSHNRWFIFKPKIPFWLNFDGLWNGKCWNVFWSFGKFCSFIGIFFGQVVL